MEIAEVFAQYLEHLFQGKRCECRELIERTLDRGVSARKLLQLIIWPAMEEVDKLFRRGRISRLLEHMATRINRMIADQLQAHLARRPKSGMRMIVSCGDGEVEELGAQVTADLFEAEGWSVWFLGAGVPNDEVLQLLNRAKADVLCLYGTTSNAVPGVRRLVDTIRDIGAHDQMQILVVGGIFKRASGLDEEIRADLYAPDARNALKTVLEHPVRIPKPDLPQPGRRRKRKTPKPATSGGKSKARSVAAAS